MPGGTNCSSSFLAPHVTLIRKIAAEFLGSFVLVFVAAAAPIVNQKYADAETRNALCAGGAVALVIVSTGHISGAHVNPAVTIAFAAFEHFPWPHVPLYLTAQVSASISASFALKGIFHPFLPGGVTVPSVADAPAFALEFIFTFILMFVITSVTTDARPERVLAGAAVGLTVFICVLVAGPKTGGSMNPIRTLGPAIAAGNYKGLWIYMVAPTVGALAGIATYTIAKISHLNEPPSQVESEELSPLEKHLSIANKDHIAKSRHHPSLDGMCIFRQDTDSPTSVATQVDLEKGLGVTSRQ